MESRPGDGTLRTRVHQQEVVADLGQQALETDDLDLLMANACEVLANTLALEYAKVLEVLPGGDEVFVRQGVGWRDGTVGNATIPTKLDSQAGYTLVSAEPIIVDDLRTEARFAGPELLTSHDVVSGVSVIIGSVDDPWGVLGVHTTDYREFASHDANFVQSVANVLAAAIEEARTKERLRKREGELEQTFDRITDGFIGLDADWTITYANERGEEILDPDGEGLIGEDFWEAFEPALGTTFEAEYREVVSTQSPSSFEEYYPPLDRWFEVHAYPSESGLSIYFRDVTEGKKRRRELARFKRAVEASGHAIYMTDVSGEITYVNPAFENTTGYTADEAIGETPSILQSAGHSWEYYQSLWETVESGEAWEEVIVDRRKDGERYYAEQTIAPVTDERGAVDRFIAVHNDITERKRRERQLEESEQRYRALAEHFPNGIVTLFDDALRYTLAAGNGFQELPVSAGDLEGKTPQEAWGAEVDDGLTTAMADALEGDPETIELTYMGRDWIVHVVPITDEEGDVFAGMTMAQDCTERHEYQRRLEESNERLEQFAYAASHDMQEPLRMISTYLALIERRYGDALDDDGQEFIEFAVDGADRMREMIDGLLEYARVETQGEPLEPVSLEEIVDDAIDALQVTIEESNAEIDVEQLPRVLGDELQLEQVYQNLIANAIQYSGDEPPEIHISADRSDRMWELSVRDEGIGIDPEDHQRIFEVFQRLHSRCEYTGTGIGLSLVQRIIERHGGEVWVDSEPGEGTTFSFGLPAAEG